MICARRLTDISHGSDSEFVSGCDSRVSAGLMALAVNHVRQHKLVLDAFWSSWILSCVQGVVA